MSEPDAFRNAMEKLASEDGPKALARLGEILGNAGKVSKKFDCERCGSRNEVEVEVIDARGQVDALKYITDYTLSKPKTEERKQNPADLKVTDATTDDQLAAALLEGMPEGTTIDDVMGAGWQEWLTRTAGGTPRSATKN